MTEDDKTDTPKGAAVWAYAFLVCVLVGLVCLGLASWFLDIRFLLLGIVTGLGAWFCLAMIGALITNKIK